MSFGGLLTSTSSGNSGGGGGGGRVVAGFSPHNNNNNNNTTTYMPSGAIAQPLFLSPPISMQSSSSTLSLSLQQRNMDGHGEIGLLAENFDPGIVGRMRDDGYESRSGSDNFEGASGDDQDGGDEQPPRKKKYHRHTPNQIQELEAFFKECPHPDEKQRLELSKRLNLENKQVKFWFQNRRTQMKTQLERHENIILRQENDKLRAENSMMKDAMANPVCNQCGGPAIPGQISFEEHQLRIENARLKDELNRICALANKFLGRPLSSLATPIPIPSSTASGLQLAVGRNGMGGLNPSSANALPMGLDLGDGIASSSSMMPSMKSSMGMMGNEMPFGRSMFVDLALAAMDELLKMAQPDTPLWIKSSEGGKETLNHEEYLRTVFSPCFGMKPSGVVTEATRDSCMVIINGLALVETLMDANRWIEMFPCLVARASTIDLISTGMGGTRNGALQVMHAELQVLSPLVPVRPLKFLRFCKQQAEGVWAVVDVSIDVNQEGINEHTFLHCRRLPSGCVVQDMPNGYSKVTWVEHSEYDESVVHQLFRELLSSGVGFGAQRWLATLQRQCECLAILMSSTVNSSEDHTAINPGGRRSMLKLAQRMVDNFCTGVCASTVGKWDKLHVGNVGEDVKVMTRKSVDDPGEPPGIVLSAATSVWIPVPQQRLFDFLRNERLRSEWDILSNGGPMQEMIHIAKGQGHGNCVSLLRASAINASESTMLILQETWSDASCSLVVYAPVDTASINVVMHGGESAYVALLPSGFAILPDGRSSGIGGSTSYNGSSNKGQGDGSSGGGGDGGGSLLTVGFQILVNSLPSAKLTVESVETVNNLISCTIEKIKAALQVS
ncbi:homeobox-leucine zipper protein ANTHOCYANINLESS 2 isoform X1 [Ziziphus jujuba]|uniref:Homeobox-leucine zipper protein ANTHOCYANINLESS 2 isoform X1 n=2 Tax=Ziziphus jujuba TaxID=326968 RepID=A0ABM3ID18_ZIZJJ|nr:homeobox-leucine zipper protein ANTHOCYANINLESS 2 isoform X1 [Ziziphus jujuba]